MDNKSAANKSEPPSYPDAEAIRPSLRRVSSEDTERPPSAQQLDRDRGEQTDASDSDGLEDDENDPADKIADFDWDDLHERYHEAVDKCHGQETELMQEWESLMTVVLHFPTHSGRADNGQVLPHLGTIRASA